MTSAAFLNVPIDGKPHQQKEHASQTDLALQPSIYWASFCLQHMLNTYLQCTCMYIVHCNVCNGICTCTTGTTLYMYMYYKLK